MDVASAIIIAAAMIIGMIRMLRRQEERRESDKHWAKVDAELEVERRRAAEIEAWPKVQAEIENYAEYKRDYITKFGIKAWMEKNHKEWEEKCSSRG